MDNAKRTFWVRRLGIVCVGMTILLMGLGAWVKANGAGLSCPDWPACYGKLLPPFPSAENGGTWHGEAVKYTQAQELYEWAHRAVVSLLFVPLVAYAWLALRGESFRPGLRLLPPSALGLYLFQAVLGAVTVVTGNPPWATTAHLLTATLFLTTLTVSACMAAFAPHAFERAGRSTATPTKPSLITTAPRFAGYTYPGEPIDQPPQDGPEGGHGS